MKRLYSHCTFQRNQFQPKLICLLRPKYHLKYLKILMVSTLVGMLSIPSKSSASSSSVYIDRYLTISNKPTTEQVDLLSQNFHVRFPNRVQTVGGAIHYLLRSSGYVLLDKSMSNEAQYLLSRPLPKVQRNFGPMSLKDGLVTLAGNTFQLIVDPAHRLISFEQKNIYSGQYQLFDRSVK